MLTNTGLWRTQWQNAVKRHEQQDFAAARDAYTSLLTRTPADSEHLVLANLSLVYVHLGDMAQAIDYGRKAVAAKPDDANAINNLGLAFKGLQQWETAVRLWQRSVELDDSQPHVWGNLANGLLHLEQHAQSLVACRRALALAPNDPAIVETCLHAAAATCQWDMLDGLIARAAHLAKTTGRINPYTLFHSCTDPQELLAINAAYAKRKTIGVTPLAPRGPRKPGKRRVGFLSTTLKDHATGYLMRDMLDYLPSDQMEIYAFNCHNKADNDFTPMLQRKFDHSVDLSKLADQQAAETIRAHDIDILIDVDGFINGARTGIAPYRPAPVQINWLGYPATMGADYIDYILADDVLVPEGHEAHYAEKIIRLPGGYQPNDPARHVDPKYTSRADFGLPDDAVVICVFNQMRKITPPVFSAWVEVLKQVDNAVLWFWDNNSHGRQNITTLLTSNGIAEDRFFFTPSMQSPFHLSRYKFVDIFADSFPYNGHTMAADALFMETPMVSLMGDVFPARVAASMMTQLGQQDWIVRTRQDYVAKLTELATDADLRAHVRQSIKDGKEASQYFSGQRFAKEMHDALMALPLN